MLQGTGILEQPSVLVGSRSTVQGSKANPTSLIYVTSLTQEHMNMPDSNMETAIDPFDTWIASRPQWLQTAASDMLAKRALPDRGDIEALSSLCMEEASGASKGKFKSLGNGAL